MIPSCASASLIFVSVRSIRSPVARSTRTADGILLKFTCIIERAGEAAKLPCSGPRSHAQALDGVRTGGTRNGYPTAPALSRTCQYHQTDVRYTAMSPEPSRISGATRRGPHQKVIGCRKSGRDATSRCDNRANPRNNTVSLLGASDICRAATRSARADRIGH